MLNIRCIHTGVTESFICETLLNSLLSPCRSFAYLSTHESQHLFCRNAQYHEVSVKLVSHTSYRHPMSIQGGAFDSCSILNTCVSSMATNHIFGWISFSRILSCINFGHVNSHFYTPIII